jgi:formate dehydrogenase maturation protein FdhE
MLSSQDQSVLDHLRKARTRHASLADLLNFYEQLFQAQFDFKALLRKEYKPEYLRAKGINHAHLAEGIPQITFDELHLEEAPFFNLYKSIVELLNLRADSPLAGKKWPMPEMVAGYAREIFDSRGPLVGSSAPAEWIRTASGFVLAPYLQTACEFIMPRITQSAWHRGYCPVCGGVPAFAALHPDFGSRTLLCSRCHGEWRFRRVGCPFCLESDQQTYYPGEEGRYRLYVCGACHRYLKTLDVRQEACDLCLPVECLVTVSMDISAQEKGYKCY